MNDFEKAAKNVGNRFDLVLIASERMREIHRKRREQEELGIQGWEARRKVTPPHQQTIGDIESGLVGREYLNRIKSRERRRRPKFEEL